MIKHEVICDYCGKKENGEEHHYGLSKGWWVVGFHGQKFLAFDDWRITHHFCSAECMDLAIKVNKDYSANSIEYTPPSCQ